MEIKVYYSLDEELTKAWEELWQRSSLAHCFNSPWWQMACMRAFGYKKMLVVAAYRENKLVGVLPVVGARKYGIGTFIGAGKQYLDKSTLLLAEEGEEVLKGLLRELAKMGNFYLNEMSGKQRQASLKVNGRYKAIKSSTGRYLPINPDPCRYLSKKNKRKIRKILDREKGKIGYKMICGEFEKCLETLVEIESNSLKRVKQKEVFSDSVHRRLCREFDRLSEGKILVCFLYYKNRPVCYRYGMVSKGVYHDWNTAYTTEYGRLSPGIILMYLMFPGLEKAGIEVVDFSRGDSRFKRELTPYKYDQYSLFYSANMATRWWWWELDKARNCLERHPRLFEKARRGKKWVERRVWKSRE